MLVLKVRLVFLPSKVEGAKTNIPPKTNTFKRLPIASGVQVGDIEQATT
jgi:hypothetical protein